MMEFWQPRWRNFFKLLKSFHSILNIMEKTNFKERIFSQKFRMDTWKAVLTTYADKKLIEAKNFHLNSKEDDDNSCFLKRSLIQIVLTDTFKAILMTLLVNFWRASRKKHTFGLKKLSRKLKKFFIKVWHFPKVYIFPENDLLETLKVALTTHRIFFRKTGKKSSIIVPERHKAVFSQNLLTQTVSLDT